MHRQTDYALQVPYETDFLYAERFAYEGLGLLAMDLLGSTTLVAGLACTATGPASLNVNVGPGRIYSKQNLEDTVWGQVGGLGGLAADTAADHQLIKQGLFRDTTAFSCPAPGTVGQSINYLIEAAFVETDAVPVSLPFVSATPPYPPVAPVTLNTVRQDKCVITVKAGVAATTGTQTTPAVDSGNVGLWVVTVANGQTTITAGNISLFGGAPFITETLSQKISQATADTRYSQITAEQSQATSYAADTGAANAYVVALSPVLLAHVTGMAIRFKAANANTGASTFNPGPGAKNLVRPGNVSLFAGDLQAGSIYTAIYDGTRYIVQELDCQTQFSSRRYAGITVPNTNTPTAIVSFGAGALVRVTYDFGGGNTFTDLVNFYQFSTPGVTPSSFGSPGTRAYTSSGGTLLMALSGAPGSATPDITVITGN